MAKPADIGKRIIGYGVPALSALLLVRLPRPIALETVVLKIAAGATAPLLAVLGGALAAAGLLRRNWALLAAGLFSAGSAIRFILGAARRPDAFAAAFGPDWESRIPAPLRARLLPGRYQPWLPNDPGVRWTRDLTIGTHHETGAPIRADLWQPPPGVPPTGLAILFFYGSAWYYFHKDFLTRRWFRRLTGQGHLVLDVAYTRGPQTDICGMVPDVKRSIAWMKTHAAEYGIDPERIVLMGESAGGHLALLAAYTPNDPAFQPTDVQTDTTVRAVIACYAPSDMRAEYAYLQSLTGPTPAWARRAGEWMGFIPPDTPLLRPATLFPQVMGGTPAQMPDRYRQISPLTHVNSGCPPTLLLHGTDDFGVTVEQSRRLAHALRAAQVPAVLVEFPGADHDFDLLWPRISPVFQSALYDTERFLALMV